MVREIWMTTNVNFCATRDAMLLFGRGRVQITFHAMPRLYFYEGENIATHCDEVDLAGTGIAFRAIAVFKNTPARQQKGKAAGQLAHRP
jgi:hypothetical protein